MQKTARKNTKYSRNERILKIGHLATALGHAKAIGVSLGEKLKFFKSCEKWGNALFNLFFVGFSKLILIA